MDRIRQWFVDHQDGENSEFLIPPRGSSYSVIPPTSPSQVILYTTKPKALMQLASSGRDIPFGIVGRYGLPHEGELNWLKAATQDHAVYFLGDADPCDLLIFAWLRARMEIAYRGICDSLLRACGVEFSDQTTIACCETESASLPLVLQYLPDLEGLLGPGCFTLLKSGRKVECEVLISCATVDLVRVLDAIVE